MTMWGVFETEESIHCIPCDENGYLIHGHTVNDFCICYPEVVAIGEDERIILNHNQIN